MCLLRNSIHLGQSDGLQDPGDHRLGLDVIGQRIVSENQTVPQHVGNHLDHILRDDIVAAANQRQRPGGRDDSQRRAR